MNRLIIFLIILFTVIPLIFVSLFNKDEGFYELYKAESDDNKWTNSVVFIANDMQNKYTAVLASALREFLKNENLRLVIFDAEGSIKKQLYYLSKSLSRKDIKALIINPCHEEKLNSMIEKYYYKNIPVIIVGKKIYKAPFDCYIGEDDIEIGFLQAEFVLEKFKNKRANIVILAGPENSVVSNQRLKGTLAVLYGFKNIKTIGILHTEGSYNSVYEEMRKFLKRTNLQVDAIIAHNDDILLGALQALNEKKVHVVSIGADALPSTLEYIKEGKVTATIYNNNFDMAYQIFKVLMKLIKKETVYSQIFIPSTIIEGKNVDRYINEVSFTYLAK